ncbi:MAG: hypothetical protein ACHQ6T_19675 [Myxococcota bacterium]
MLLLGAICIPLTLLWDFAWESTIGVDRILGPPHAANYLAVALAFAAALQMSFAATRSGVAGIAVGRVRAPLGAWISLWGAVAFAAALLFDRWWQSSYGLAAGIWHPPQIAKALAYFAVVAGAWIAWLGRREGELRAAVAAGALLAMISVVTTAQSFANRQHSAVFFELGCASYPLVLVAHAAALRRRAAATSAALAYMTIIAVMVWLLPLVPGTPEAGPVYNARTHLLPPPFPLLLVVPALALDALVSSAPRRVSRATDWLSALEAGLAFTALFIAAQWLFAPFLLSPAADGWLFAGGGREWPFFLRIDPALRSAFWETVSPDLDWASAGIAALLAVASARAGLWLGSALRQVRR